MVKQIHIAQAIVDVASGNAQTEFVKRAYIAFGEIYFFFRVNEAKKRTQIVYAVPNTKNVFSHKLRILANINRYLKFGI